MDIDSAFLTAPRGKKRPRSLESSPSASTDPEAPHKHDEEVLIPFFLQYPSTPGTRAAPLGFLRPSVANALLEDHHSQLDASGGSCWSFHGKDHPLTDSLSKNDMWALSFSPHIRSEALRTQAVTRLVGVKRA